MYDKFSFNEYKEELELIETQNKVECDLYSIIVCLIRKSQHGRGISVRDVSARRSTEFSNVFKGDGGFPDFVIRTRIKSNDAENLGAIEVKYLNKNLDDEDNRQQLSGHIVWYKKVIYTNGLEWRFYNEKEKTPEWTICLGEYKNENIVWFEESKWKELLDGLNEIQWNA